MNGHNTERNDFRVNKNQGADIGREAKKEYQEKLKEYFDQFNTYEDVLSKKDIQGWDAKFQNYVTYLIKSQHDFKRNFMLSEKLIDHVGQFRETSASIV